MFRGIGQKNSYGYVQCDWRVSEVWIIIDVGDLIIASNTSSFFAKYVKSFEIEGLDREDPCDHYLIQVRVYFYIRLRFSIGQFIIVLLDRYASLFILCCLFERRGQARVIFLDSNTADVLYSRG